RALLPVHLYGQCADMDALQHLAEEFDLVIIEDAAQAIGAKWRGRQAGSLGTAAAFSFYPTKNLSAFGDAGLAITGDAALGEHMRRELPWLRKWRMCSPSAASPVMASPASPKALRFFVG